MSKELFDAAERGDLKEVERLLQVPGVEIDYTARYLNAPSSFKYQYTPASISIKNSHFEVAKKLIAAGASIFGLEDGIPVQKDKLYPIAMYVDKSLPADLCKMILQRIKYLDVYILYYNDEEIHAKRLSTLILKTHIGQINYLYESLYFLEVIYRGELTILEKCKVKLGNLLFTDGIFLEFIRDRCIGENDLINIEFSLAFFVKYNFIGQDEAKKIKIIAEQQYHAQHSFSAAPQTELEKENVLLKEKLNTLEQQQRAMNEKLDRVLALLTPQQEKGNKPRFF